ncbi:MAG: Rrf2 family transcriptional regulator [Chloroflexi bacterium]|nr:Rrf2 family transcriptional regulator [Chloroflexota bacterium]
MSYSLSFSQAILLVIYVADKVEQGFFDFVPTKQLSEDLNIARPTAVKILQSLNGAGIIETREGAKGGIRLAVAPASVTVLDIFNAVESGKALFRHDFRPHVTGKKPTRAQDELLTIFGEAESAMKDRLAETAVSDLLTALNQ